MPPPPLAIHSSLGKHFAGCYTVYLHYIYLYVFSDHESNTREAMMTNKVIRMLLLLLDLLRNKCSHIQHTRCTNTLTSYILKTHTDDKISHR